MFKDAAFFATYSVDDLTKAKDFYANTLGLDATEMYGMLQLKAADGTKVMIYPRPDHKAAVFTVLNIPVPKIEPAMTELKKAGVTFEVYDTEDTKTDKNGIAHYGKAAAAWFKDPAGNLIALLEGM